MRAIGVFTGARGAAAVALLAACGCGGNGELTGTVTYRGQKLRSGAVQVRGSDGIVRASLIDADGRFVVPGVPTGPTAVAVSSLGTRPGRSVPAARGGRGARLDPTPSFSLLPVKFSDLDRSGLGTTVEGGTNVFDIELR
jgi:hypothetical protein